MAAKATLALNAGLWFRRGRLFIRPPFHGILRRCQAKTPFITPVRICEPLLESSRKIARIYDDKKYSLSELSACSSFSCLKVL